MNIYVGNLPYSVRDEELRATFEPYGSVASAEVIFDRRTRRSRGYGFVEMPQAAEAERAIRELNGVELHGRELRVDASQPKSEGGERPPPRTRAPREPRAAQPQRAENPTGIKGFLKRLFG